jgi:hypothetical protein
VDDVSVALEHVDLLNGLDGLYIELLEGALELLVVGTGALVHLLDFPARGAFSAVTLLAVPFSNRSAIVRYLPSDSSA